ncbi:MAG TPA: cellulase family glycosylhydrolase [Candidatus Saccharimonadales bacterium]|nr:cellulase family glycosylhydrolase [Candidatus Saccharimonadales bacterium]
MKRFHRRAKKVSLHRRAIIVGSCLLGVGLALIVVQQVVAPALIGKRTVTLLPFLHHVAVQPQPAVDLSAKALGIAAGSSLPSLSDEQLAARLDGIHAAGARWVRLDFDWSTVQPASSTSFDWTAYDKIVAAVTSRHMEVLGILDYTPSWARPAGCDSNLCAPASATPFAAYAAAAARRYSSRGVHAWEIWNEPNNPTFWQPAANPGAYTALLKLAYTAVHQNDTQAVVTTAGLSPQATANGAYSPYDFAAAMYTSGAHGYFDALGDHPYTFPLSPADSADDAWTQMAGANHSLRSLMIAHGDADKKIWITEYGAPTGGPGPVSTNQQPNLDAHPYTVDEARQATLLSDALRLYRTYSWAGPMFYYSYQDAGTDPSTNENFFGLVSADGTKKAAYSVYASAATQGF